MLAAQHHPAIACQGDGALTALEDELFVGHDTQSPHPDDLGAVRNLGGRRHRLRRSGGCVGCRRIRPRWADHADDNRALRRARHHSDEHVVARGKARSELADAQGIARERRVPPLPDTDQNRARFLDALYAPADQPLMLLLRNCRRAGASSSRSAK